MGNTFYSSACTYRYVYWPHHLDNLKLINFDKASSLPTCLISNGPEQALSPSIAPPSNPPRAKAVIPDDLGFTS